MGEQKQGDLKQKDFNLEENMELLRENKERDFSWDAEQEIQFYVQ